MTIKTRSVTPSHCKEERGGLDHRKPLRLPLTGRPSPFYGRRQFDSRAKSDFFIFYVVCFYS